MQTRHSARQASARLDPGLACWLPQDAQACIITHALSSYATPDIRCGMVMNPARDIVALMRVCKAWAAVVTSSPVTATRCCSDSLLRASWLTDVAHLAGAGGGQSKQAKLNRIPQTLRLMLPSCPSSSNGSSCAAGSSTGPAAGAAVVASTSAGSTTGARAAADAPLTAAQGAPESTAHWRTARVLRRRSAFEASSFPLRVPLLALDAGGLRPHHLAWLLSVLASNDAAFLCPAVLRLTLPPPPPATAAAAAAASRDARAGTEGSSSKGGGSIANRAAADGAAGAAAAPVQPPQPPQPPQPQRPQLLTRAGVQALASQTVAVGSDGPHLYLVPTGTTLRRTWQPHPTAG